jgi:superfamily II DNA helicase RecQ
MPFQSLPHLDPERLKRTSEMMCAVFGLPSLHPWQEEAGQNILKGKSTLLDAPTGIGKTMAFWYPLFYHMSSFEDIKHCKKVVLVIGPLSALLEAQAQDLSNRGIPAIALTSEDTELSIVHMKVSLYTPLLPH